MRRGIFFGWWIVTGGFFIQLLNGGLFFHAFSAYVLPLQEAFGWNKSQVSGAFAMARAESGILGPVQGWAIDKFGPRIIMTIGITMFGLGFIALSQINSLLMYYAAFVLIAFGSSLGGFMSLATTITNWFSRRRATSMGIMMTGMGVGGLLVPLVVLSLDELGWRQTAMISGILILVIGLPVAQIMRHSPERYGMLPDGDAVRYREGKREPAPEITGLTPRQALKSQAFWMLSLSHGAALLIVGAALLHQIPHMVEGMGLTERTAGSVVAFLVAINIGSQLAGGFIGDRINKKIGIAGCLFFHALAMAVFAVSTSLVGALVFALLHGTAWGVRAPLINSIRADYFGRAHYGTIMGFMSLLVMMGMTLGPLFAAFLNDLTGSYRTPFLILAGIASLGSITALSARKPKLPDPTATP